MQARCRCWLRTPNICVRTHSFVRWLLNVAAKSQKKMVLLLLLAAAWQMIWAGANLNVVNFPLMSN